MIVSEKGAREKWCPMVRAETANNPDGPASNRIAPNEARSGRSDKNPEWSRCIGPACMFWRVAATAGTAVSARPEDAERLLRENPERYKDDGAIPSLGSPVGRRLIYREDVGFCGAAGVPE